MIFLAFLLYAVLFILAVALGGWDKLGVFVDVPSILLILLGITGFTLHYGRKHFRRGIKTFFAFSFPPDDESAETGRFFMRLAEFTVRWGLVIMGFGLVMMLMDLDADHIGSPVAVALLSFLYASGLAVFVFLPIGLRLSPPDLQPVTWKLAVRLAFTGIVIFFMVRLMIVLLGFSWQNLRDHQESYLQFNTTGQVLRQTFFVINPADPQGNYSPFQEYGFPMYWDFASLIVVVGSWWLFRMASGRRRKLIAAPVIILIGIFWSITGFCMMLCDIDLDTFGAGVFVSMLPTLYAFIGAAGFLIVDMWKSGDCGVPSSPAPCEGIDQAKEIIDRVVENERR